MRLGGATDPQMIESTHMEMDMVLSCLVLFRTGPGAPHHVVSRGSDPAYHAPEARCFAELAQIVTFVHNTFVARNSHVFLRGSRGPMRPRAARFEPAVRLLDHRP